MPFEPKRYGGLIVFQVNEEDERRLSVQVPRAYYNRFLDDRYDEHYRHDVVSTVIETFGTNLKLFGGFFTRADLCSIFKIATEQGRLVEEFILTETDRYSLNPRREAILTAKMHGITNGLVEAAEAELEYYNVIRDMQGTKAGTLNDALDRATRVARHAMEAIKMEIELDRRHRREIDGAEEEGDEEAADWKEKRTVVLEEVYRRVTVLSQPDKGLSSLENLIDAQARALDE